jgi:A/G-specific adenine glycosylase
MVISSVEQLRRWFLHVKREMPWRQQPTPYQVWVSEVMLQQTQVAVVIPYYQRWMERWPTVAHLAAAPIEAVIKQWEGLGYYQRARSLHAGARVVMERWGGELPADRALLETVPGLGPYTVAAVLNFAFHQRAPLVDGNVIRVVSRFFGVEEKVDRAAGVRRIWEMTEQLLPEQEPWVISEALMELGALVCTPQPRCDACPLKANCRALQSGDPARLPVRRPRPKIERLYRAVALVRSSAGVLVRRGDSGKLMADLYQFPYCETGPRGIDPDAQQQWLRQTLGLEAALAADRKPVSHSFTRYRVQLQPRLFHAAPQPVAGHQWIAEADLLQLPFCAGHRQLVQIL